MVPRDFKERPARKKSAPRKSRRNVVPAPARWPAFLAGLCVGAVVTVALFLYEPGTGVDLATRVDSATKNVPGDESKPTFEFYTMLPEKEIVIPEASLDEPPAAAPGTDRVPPRKPATDDGVRYVLQVASLRKYEDADRLKARLALIGLESSIQTVSVDGSETWHRVRVGPLTGREALNQARSQLSRNKFPVLVMRLK